MDIESYAFIVETNSEAYEFHKELCAFMTGCTNSNSLDLDFFISNIYKQQFKPLDFIEKRYSESIGETYSCVYYDYDENMQDKNEIMQQSVVIYLSRYPTKEEIDFLKQKAYEYAKELTTNTKIIGFKLHTSIHKEIIENV